MTDPESRRATFLDLLPRSARLLRKGGMLWRPDSCGYTYSIFDAGIYIDDGFLAGHARGHSEVVDPAYMTTRSFDDGSPGALALDEIARLRDALDLIRRSHHAGPSEFARRVLAGEPTELAKGCLVEEAVCEPGSRP